MNQRVRSQNFRKFGQAAPGGQQDRTGCNNLLAAARFLNGFAQRVPSKLLGRGRALGKISLRLREVLSLRKMIRLARSLNVRSGDDDLSSHDHIDSPRMAGHHYQRATTRMRPNADRCTLHI